MLRPLPPPPKYEPQTSCPDAVSLAMNPHILLLDEVNAGLNTTEVEQALELIRAIAARGISIVIIEHLLKVVTGLCSRIIVLHHGELIADDGNIIIHRFKVLKVPFVPQMSS